MQSFGGHTLYNLQNHVCWGDRDSIYKIILSHAYLVRTCDLSVGGELRLAVKGDSINQRVTTCDNCFTGQPRQNMCWLVVYLPHPTPLKNDGVKVSWDDDIPFPYEMENKSHVWNHQAVCDSLTHLPRSKPVGWTVAATYRPSRKWWWFAPWRDGNTRQYGGNTWHYPSGKLT